MLVKAFTLFFLLATLANCSVLMAGVDKHNTREFVSSLNKNTVKKLQPIWNASTDRPITCTPLVKNGRVCYSGYDGLLVCRDQETGALHFSKNFTSDYGFPAGLFARVMPTYHNGTLILATGSIKTIANPGYGAWFLVVDFETGNLLWSEKMTDHAWASVGQSPVVDGDFAYVGMSSGEFVPPVNPNTPCCSFAGTMYAYDLSSRSLMWNRSMIPDELRGPGKYAGAAIWGSTPVVVGDDLYFGTGQLYKMPDSVIACVNANITDPTCIDERVLFDALVRVNKNTGEIIGSYRGWASDVWNAACFYHLPWCQSDFIDWDFDMTTVQYSALTDTLYAGAKSGLVFSFNRDLTVRWTDMLAFGSVTGGITYQNALQDDSNLEDLRLFVNSANADNHPFSLPNGTNVTSGVWIAYDGYGNVKWATPCAHLKHTYGAMTVSNNVVFGYTKEDKQIVGLNAHNGNVLWTFTLEQPTAAAPALDGKYLFTGSGTGVATAANNYQFRAFKIMDDE